MRIAIFGANGRTGILTVYQALDKGHYVTSFAHDPENTLSFPIPMKKFVKIISFMAESFLIIDTL